MTWVMVGVCVVASFLLWEDGVGRVWGAVASRVVPDSALSLWGWSTADQWQWILTLDPHESFSHDVPWKDLSASVQHNDREAPRHG